LCALSFLRVQSSFVFHVRTQLRVNATHSTCSWSVELREQVIPREWSHTRGGVCDPKNRKKAKKAKNRPKRKNEQRRNTPNSGARVFAATYRPEFGVLPLCSKPVLPGLAPQGIFG